MSDFIGNFIVNYILIYLAAYALALLEAGRGEKGKRNDL
jgi:hypothetical protein